MKKNINIANNLLILLATLMLCVYGCAKNTKKKHASPQLTITAGEELPKRLISDYNGMKETDHVKWIWIKPGFSMESCGTIKIYPLKNFSNTYYPSAEKKLEDALKNIFRQIETKEKGNIEVGAQAAILEMKLKKSFLERFYSSPDQSPCIEVELVLFDEASKSVLLKLCHSKKMDDFTDALHGLIEDLQSFFLSDASRLQGGASRSLNNIL
jgi:hypothetical protein